MAAIRLPKKYFTGVPGGGCIAGTESQKKKKKDNCIFCGMARGLCVYFKYQYLSIYFYFLQIPNCSQLYRRDFA